MGKEGETESEIGRMEGREMEKMVGTGREGKTGQEEIQ